jgi:hypothetical protein
VAGGGCAALRAGREARAVTHGCAAYSLDLSDRACPGPYVGLSALDFGC